MLITIFSACLTQHMLPLCLNLKSIENVKFHFVASNPMSNERKKMGFDDMNDQYDFVIKQYDYDSKERINYFVENSDIVIFGGFKNPLLTKRLKTNRITYIYSERMFKSGYIQIFSPKLRNEFWNIKQEIAKRPVFLLCSGNYVSSDLYLLCCFKNKAFKWGYFPPFEKYDIESIISNKNNEKIEILWVGRFLHWKHPSLCITVARFLKKHNLEFRIQMIGDGPKRNEMERKIRKYNLEKHIILLSYKKPTEIRNYMLNTDIFLATSDMFEGWGAVINEAMNSGAAIVASVDMGATPYLIQNGINGYIYKSNRELLRQVLDLCKDKNRRIKFSLNAYKTIEEKWNAEIAANRLVAISKMILNGKNYEIFDEGICSTADRKYRGKLINLSRFRKWEN